MFDAALLPAYPAAVETLVAARNTSMLAAAAAGASIGQMAQALHARSGVRARQMLDLAPLPGSAREETLHDWGVTLRRRRSGVNVNRGQLAVLAMTTRDVVVALEDGERMPAPEEVELLRAALAMSPQNRSARLRVVREQQVAPRPLPQRGGRHTGPMTAEQEQRLAEIRVLLAALRPLMERRDDLLAATQASGLPMTRIASETGLTAADVRRSIDGAQRRSQSTQQG